MIERGDSECPHGRAPGLGSLEDRVDEGCDRAALGKHQESAEQEHHHEHGQQPEKDLRSTCGRVRSCTEAGLQKLFRVRMNTRSWTSQRDSALAT